MSDEESSNYILRTRHGVEIIVDPDVYEWASKRKWCLNSDGYPQGRLPGFNITRKLHHQIIGKNKSGHIDHINGDPLDNRRVNLRKVTYAQNQMNRNPTRNSSSKFKGVVWRPRENKWIARITVNKVCRSLGHFKTQIRAAMVYNLAAAKDFGEYARLNKFKLEDFNE